MDTKKIMWAIGGGFAGFLVLLCAHGVLLFALMASITFLSGPKISSLSWFLFVVVIPPLITVAAALPAIGLGFGKKFSLITGFIAFILASIIITHPSEKSGGLFNMTSTLASIIPVGTTMLAISFRLPEGRKKRVGIIMGTWMIFSILGVAISSFSQIGGGLTVLLTWLVLPAIVASFQPETGSC